MSDTGRYTCVASNIAGEDELEFDVNIQGKRVVKLSWLPAFLLFWDVGINNFRSFTLMWSNPMLLCGFDFRNILLTAGM